MKRRTFLVTGAVAGSLSTGGCLSRLGIGGDAESDDTDEDARDNHEEAEDGSEADDHDEQGDSDDSADANTDDEVKSEDEDDSEEDADEDDEDEDPYPDEEDTEIDRDQYDDPPEQPEREERDSDDVEIEATSHVDEYGELTIEGTITNVSAEPIDEVVLKIEVYNPDDEYLWGDTAGITDLASGASETFESGWTADEERGEVGYIEIDPTVYDLVDDDENGNGNGDEA